MKHWMIWGIGIAIGAATGYLYWYYVGCLGGSCTITSSSVNNTVYGGVLGALLVNALSPAKNKK